MGYRDPGAEAALRRVKASVSAIGDARAPFTIAASGPAGDMPRIWTRHRKPGRCRSAAS
jgi:hypothetical protein